MATKKKLTSKAKYVPNRMINEIEVERNGRTTTIDGADLFDGAYVNKNVKFAKGGGISQKVDKIASKLKPVALKHSGSPKEGYSVQVKDKTSGFTAWVDVWVDEEYNDVAWEWNKYIFDTDDDSDVLHSALQDNIIIAEEMSSVAILYLEDKGAIRQDNNAKWHYNKKFGNGGGVAVSSESGLAEGTNADLLMNQNNLQYRKGGGLKGKSNYISNRMINEMEVERNGKTTIIDGADLLDGAYVKKGVKYNNGGGVAVSSESGLAFGTNADLLMNEQNLQYGKGSTVKGKDSRGEFGTFVYQIMENGIIREEKIVKAGYSKLVRKMAEEEAMKFGVRSEVIVRKLSDKKYNNGGGVAVSSESGLAFGTNADLLMNEQNLQYEDGGRMGTWCYEIGGL